MTGEPQGDETSQAPSRHRAPVTPADARPEDDEHPAAAGAADEMAIGETEGSFGQSFTVSVPAQLRFTGDVEQRTDVFHEALRSHGVRTVDQEPDRNAEPGKPHYEGEVYFPEHYARLRVLVFRGGVVRLYPRDDHEPSVGELARVLLSLEAGFGSGLVHDPIDRTDAR